MVESGGSFSGGFWDWLRAGQKLKSSSSEESIRKQLTPKGAVAIEAELVRLTRALSLQDKPRYIARELLHDVGEAAVPHLMDRLREPEFWETDVNDWYYCPYGIAILLLQSYMPAECLEIVLPKLDDPDESIQQAAACYIARLGSDPCVAPLEQMLNGDCEDLLRVTYHGLLECLRAGRGSSRLREMVFDTIVPSLADTNYSEQIVELLLRIDEGRAKSILLGEQYFHLGYGGLHDLLRAFAKLNVQAPVDQIREFAESLRTDHAGYPNEYHYAECLKHLVKQRHPDAAELVHEALHSSERNVRGSACNLLLDLHGLDPFNVVYERLETVGFSRLSPLQQQYVAVDRLFCEVNNGGFAQYFANSSGDYASVAVEAYTAIGASDAAEIVRQALSVFRAEGPPADREDRSAQLSALPEESLDLLNHLDAEFYGCQDQIDVLLTEFVVNNRDSFVEESG